MSARILLAALTLLLVSACAAPAPNPQEVHHTVLTPSGVWLNARVWRPRAATPTAALVIVHGLKDHSGRYADLADKLVERGLAVYALDLRGHGQSEGDRVWVDEFKQYVDDLACYVASVRSEQPGRPLFLFGHSMGGAIVTLYALDKKPDLAGLILSAPAIRLDVAAPTRAFAHVASTLTPRVAIMSLDDDLFSRDPASVKAMREDPLVYDDNGPARTAGELFNAIAEIQDRMEEVKVPLLLLHGTKDQVTMPEGSEELARRAGSTDKTLKLYAGFYHDLLHEPAPDRAKVMADIVGWLDARAKRK